MLHRLCGSPSIPLSFNLAAVLPRWDTYCVSCGTEGVRPPTPSIHRLRRGLPGYLILFAPHAFAPQRQLLSRKPPSPLVFLLISMHFTATLGIPLSSPVLKIYSFSKETANISRRYHDFLCRASASVVVQKVAFATGVLPNLYAFHRYTRNSAFLSDTQGCQFQSQPRG